MSREKTKPYTVKTASHTRGYWNYTGKSSVLQFDLIGFKCNLNVYGKLGIKIVRVCRRVFAVARITRGPRTIKLSYSEKFVFNKIPYGISLSSGIRVEKKKKTEIY